MRQLCDIRRIPFCILHTALANFGFSQQMEIVYLTFVELVMPTQPLPRFRIPCNESGRENGY